MMLKVLNRWQGVQENTHTHSHTHTHTHTHRWLGVQDNPPPPHRWQGVQANTHTHTLSLSHTHTHTHTHTHRWQGVQESVPSMQGAITLLQQNQLLHEDQVTHKFSGVTLNIA